MFKKVLFLILMLAVPFCLMAQSSGKIMGVVTDSETGEPLPGVNVILQGTLLGATSDVDGYYVILNVPVDVYTIEASYVGYSKYVIQNVRVSSDVTTQQDFKMSPTTLELGEAVVVTAKRPLIEKHVTYSTAKVTGEELANQPIRGLNAIMSYLPSVVVQDGVINIRGGRGEEVGYYLDGASTMNPINRTNAVHVIQEALEEVQVLTGGFSAEYGNANSGIVKQELRGGTPEYHFSLTAETDKFAGEGEKFLDTYSYQDHLIVATASGPITNNIRFFAAGEWNKIGDTQKRFSEGFNFPGKVDENPAQQGNLDVIDLVYPSGFTPNNWSDRYAGNATVSFNYDPFRFRLSGVFNHRRFVGTNSPMLNLLENRWVEDVNDHALISGKFTHVLSAKTYYDVNLAYYSNSYDEEDPYFGNDWQKWGDSTAVSNATNGAVTYRDKYLADRNYFINGIYFTRPGGDETYQKSKQTYLGGGLDFVSQVTKNHELKFGFDYKMYTIRSYSIDPYVVAFTDPNYDHGLSQTAATIGDIPFDVISQYMGNTYGYDVYGNEIDHSEGNLDGARSPQIGAAYITDKIEYEDLIINLGLRLDYFDADDYTVEDPTDIEIDKTDKVIADNAWKKVDPHIHVSPRIGISFPVSETTVFYTQYGKFVQMPEFNDFYYNNYQFGRQIVRGGYFYLTPVGFGFDPIFTTNYELGFKKQLGNFAAIDISGFYKNVKGQIMTTRVTKAPGADIVTYNALVNGDFATNKGLEFKLTMRRYNRLQGQVNYTYTSAEGTGSGETSYISAVDRAAQVPTILSPVNFQQKHRGAIILDYRFAQGDGGPVFDRFGVNLMYRFNSGHPYTRVVNVGGQSGAYDGGVDYMNDTRSRKAIEPINASTTPWVNNVDLRIDKSFSLTNQLMATVYCRITNLFNTKNVVNVYQETGSATDDGYITNPARYQTNYTNYGGQDYLDLYHALNTVNGSSYLSQLGLELYDTPRQIIFGLKLNY